LSFPDWYIGKKLETFEDIVDSAVFLVKDDFDDDSVWVKISLDCLLSVSVFLSCSFIFSFVCISTEH
jgi:hypothetical protein